MDEAEEILDLVDAKDRVIGTIRRGEIPKLFETTGKYIRYSNCLIQNRKGQLWIPRRTTTKTIAPSGLDFSASEHVQASEPYLTAAVRGLQEELGLVVKPEVLEPIGKLAPDDQRPFFSMIYRLTRQQTPRANPDDFSGFEWLSPQELLDRLQTGEVAKADLAAAVRLLLRSA